LVRKEEENFITFFVYTNKESIYSWNYIQAGREFEKK
jgi:hypothetical protein